MTQPDELTEVFSTNDIHEAEVLRVALNNEGLQCQIDGGGQGGFSGIMEVKLLVRAADEQKARAYLKEKGDLS